MDLSKTKYKYQEKQKTQFYAMAQKWATKASGNPRDVFGGKQKQENQTST